MSFSLGSAASAVPTLVVGSRGVLGSQPTPAQPRLPGEGPGTIPELLQGTGSREGRERGEEGWDKAVPGGEEAAVDRGFTARISPHRRYAKPQPSPMPAVGLFGFYCSETLLCTPCTTQMRATEQSTSPQQAPTSTYSSRGLAPFIKKSKI